MKNMTLAQMENDTCCKEIGIASNETIKRNVFSICKYYERDHDRLDTIFQEYLDLRQADLSLAAERFHAFESGLQRHFTWEEEILFPLYEKTTGINEGPTTVLREEHNSIYRLLQMIHNKIQRKKTCSDREETLLLIAFGQHQLKEEYYVYPTLDRLLTKEEKSIAFQKMQDIS